MAIAALPAHANAVTIGGEDGHEPRTATTAPMSAICGYAGGGDAAWLGAMLAPVAYRGDAVAQAQREGFGVATRFSPPLFRHGELSEEADQVWAVAGATLSDKPAAAKLAAVLASGDWATVDGAFAAAHWHAPTATLTLVRDPFGIRSLYYAQHQGCLVFASELKQLLALPGFAVQADPVAVHKYLTFSFVPGDAVPVLGVRRLLPGHVLRWQNGRLRIEPWFVPAQLAKTVQIDPAAAAQALFKLGQQAVKRRLRGHGDSAAVYLSGGIDSSAVALWLRRAGVDVTAFTLDFGADDGERAEAAAVAQHLGLALHSVPAGGQQLADALPATIEALDLPFGDAVTVPQMLLGQAARKAGFAQVWNGEFGDQLLGGWTQKPMLAAALYADESAEPEEQYLRAYHRFYGAEAELYTPEFASLVGGPGQRRAHLKPYLGDPAMADYLTRVRLADLALKGCQNIVPRAERIAAFAGLQLHMPFCDRPLAALCLSLPPACKLNGSCEKYALKLALQGKLPDEIVWRRKQGMGAPATDWVLGPLREVVEDALGDAAVKRRGWFNPAYVAELRQGRAHPLETRRRRIGEKLWALLMLELWLRRFVDGHGRAP